MSRRRLSDQPFSLFAFQDIITSITAIVILITMILAIELVSRASQTPAVDKTNIENTLSAEKQKIDALQAAIKAIEQDVEAAEISFPSGETSHLSLEELKQQQRRLQQKLNNLRKRIVVTESPDKNQPDEAGVQAEIAKLSQEAKRLQSILDELRDSNAVIFKPSEDSIQQAWIIDLSGERFRLLQIGGKEQERIIRGDDTDARVGKLETFLSNLDPERNYFLIMLRPSAADGYFKVLDLIQNKDFEVGAELIGEKKVVKNQAANEGDR